MSCNASPPTGNMPPSTRSRARANTSAATPTACGVEDEVPLWVWLYAEWFGRFPDSPMPAPGMSVGPTSCTCAPKFEKFAFWSHVVVAFRLLAVIAPTPTTWW